MNILFAWADLLIPAFPNNYVVMLFALTLGSILTWSYLHHYLDELIHAIISLVLTAGATIMSLVIMVLLKVISIPPEQPHTSRRPQRHISDLSPIVKSLIYLSIGSGIFILDHFFASKFVAEDTTDFYFVTINGTKYWFMDYTAVLGGLFLLIGVYWLYIFVIHLLDVKFRFSVTIRN